MSDAAPSRPPGDDSIYRLEDLIADAVEQKLAPYLDRIAELARVQPTQQSVDIGAALINGLDPDRLYSVPFLRERWGVGSEFFYRLDHEDLPRASWPGKEIRYRGSDILRAEGVDIDVAPVHRHPASRQRKASPRPPKRTSRPYAKDLPEL